MVSTIAAGACAAEATEGGQAVEHRYVPAGMDNDAAEKIGALLQDRLSSLIDLSLILKHVRWLGAMT